MQFSFDLEKPPFIPYGVVKGKLTGFSQDIIIDGSSYCQIMNSYDEITHEYSKCKFYMITENTIPKMKFEIETKTGYWYN